MELAALLARWEYSSQNFEGLNVLSSNFAETDMSLSELLKYVSVDTGVDVIDLPTTPSEFAILVSQIEANI